jgi:hypothetical protein
MASKGSKELAQVSASTESEEASEGAGDDAGQQPREVQRDAAFVQPVLVGHGRRRLGELHIVARRGLREDEARQAM